MPTNLPLEIISLSDLRKVERELTALDEYFLQASSRQTGTPMQLPKASHRLNQLAAANSLNLIEPPDRQQLIKFCAELAARAPSVNVSFASEPSAAFSQKILEWFRREIHPQTLITFGFQPSIVAGCVVRTTNRYFDLSLRHFFDQNRPKLIESLSTQNG